MSHILLYEIRFVLFCFRSTLFTESFLFSFPLGTKMLQFPRFPSNLLYEIGQFKYLGIKGCMRLPQAYRSLPRSYSVYKPSYPLISIVEIKENARILKNFLNVILEHALQLQISQLLSFCFKNSQKMFDKFQNSQNRL